MTKLVLIAASVVLAGAAIVAVLLSADDAEQPLQARPDAPNFIVVMTDDQALNMWSREVMPHTFDRIVDPGTEFNEAFALPPLCCPARVSFMTGRYPHNHGVSTNNYTTFNDPEDVLPVWLDEAGYETMMAGKWLHRYEKFQGTNQGLKPAPGWDRWWGISADSAQYFDYEVSVDGEPKSYGSSDEDYLTNALTDAAVDFVGERSSDDPPFFLWMAHFAPHFGSRDAEGSCPPEQSAIALESDFEAAKGVRVPKPPNYFEEDVSDKPPFIASGEEAPLARDMLRRRQRCAVASLAAVDRSVEEIFKTLEATGQAEETVVFFISDNGIFLGEHRRREGKELAYDPSLKIPLAVVAPPDVLGAPPLPTADETVGTIDLAPTMLDLAGLEGEHRVDGRSLLGAMSEDEEPLPAGRGVAVEIGRDEKIACTGYEALRDREFLFTQYRQETASGTCGKGFEELYDVRQDPFQLENLLGLDQVDPADRARADALAERLARLTTCSGIEGRDPPTDAPFCE